MLLLQASTASTSHTVQNISHAREKPHYESLKLLNAAQGDACRIETHWGQGDGLQSLLYSRQTHSTQQQIFNSVSLNPFTCSSFTAQKQSTHLKKARHRQRQSDSEPKGAFPSCVSINHHYIHVQQVQERQMLK